MTSVPLSGGTKRHWPITGGSNHDGGLGGSESKGKGSEMSAKINLINSLAELLDCTLARAIQEATTIEHSLAGDETVEHIRSDAQALVDRMRLYRNGFEQLMHRYPQCSKCKDVIADVGEPARCKKCDIMLCALCVQEHLHCEECGELCDDVDARNGDECLECGRWIGGCCYTSHYVPSRTSDQEPGTLVCAMKP